MLSVAEALELVLQAARPLPAVRTPVVDALGCVLAEDATSDLDSPPWDKSMVDGYAIRASDLASGTAELQILEEVVAGAVPSKTVQPGAATRIMTGAPVPAGADAVVMIERSELLNPASRPRVRLQDIAPRRDQNIVRQASSFRQGDTIVPAGVSIAPVHVGLLCEIGAANPLVVPRPRVAVLSTGNELVAPERQPLPGQIRNSNGPMLAAFVTRAGATPLVLDVARDERADLRRLIRAGLEADLLILSGGVSAGVLDLVPSVLAELGVEQVFHKVRLKPGKPLWFGVRDRDGRRTLVFGLPGNPVSSLVGFELFVRPAIQHLAGKHPPAHPAYSARLGHGEFRQRGDRPTYYPAFRDDPSRFDADMPVASLLPWSGSADLRSLALADVLVVFPAGEKHYAGGDLVEVLPLSN